MIKNRELEFITKQFFKDKSLINSTVLQGGIINQTYLVALGNRKSDSYILQKINTQVFKNPEIVMSNFSLISQHIQEKIEQQKELSYQNFRVYPNSEGNLYYIHPDKGFWRLIDFVDAKPVDNTKLNAEIVAEAGKILGRFHSILSDIDISKIQTSIPNFHHTNLYYKQFVICTKNKSERLNNSLEVFSKIKGFSYLVEDYLNIKELLPVRIVHNDPKLDNILFDSDGKACTMIDLDTCMPGYLTTDFGDAIRSISNTTTENEKNINKVHFDLKIFEIFYKAYFSEVKAIITPIEKEHLAFFALLITYEQLIRFYNDYIQGDIYYKTDYPEHNLQRARVQLKLLEEMGENIDKMQAITAY